MLALIVNLVEFSRRNAVLVTAVVVLVAIFSAATTPPTISASTPMSTS